MRLNLPVTNNELELQDSAFILTKSDLHGVITSVNQDFIDVSGYTEAELIGQPHNLIRHPDVPVQVFTDLWATLKRGLQWDGVIKNRCKNGDFYWVEAEVAPLRKDGNVVGFVSFRKKASRKQVEDHERIYLKIREHGLTEHRFRRGEILEKRNLFQKILKRILPRR